MNIQKEIAERFFSHFCNIPQKDLAKRFKVQQSVISEWKTGKRRIPWNTLIQFAEDENIDLDWLFVGKSRNKNPKPMSAEKMAELSAKAKKFPFPEFKMLPNATRPREPINFVLDAKEIPVVGRAAADETQGSRAGFFPPDPEAHFDQVTIPPTTAAVEIIGDSMSPVLLHGQFALLGPEYSGAYDQPKNYEIVVADVEVKDGDQAGSDERWEGVYCKRIVDAGDVWVFLSINQTGTPFSVAKANCRVWPVIGVYFAGKGRIPED